MIRFLKVGVAVVCAAALCLIAESLLQPKLRVVTLEGVPSSLEPPAVTFMTGAVMDPLVHTNPFFEIFSPLDNLTARLRVPKGEIQEISDTAVVFVWEIFDRLSIWHIDRSTQTLTPLFITPRDSKVHVCSRIFPGIAWYSRNHPLLRVRKTPTPGGIEIFDGSIWTPADIFPQSRTLVLILPPASE
ncbi:hypothetical protein HY522_03970 [bacterium]|nr:hypothetical protein [bacterium]